MPSSWLKSSKAHILSTSNKLQLCCLKITGGKVVTVELGMLSRRIWKKLKKGSILRTADKNCATSRLQSPHSAVCVSQSSILNGMLLTGGLPTPHTHTPTGILKVIKDDRILKGFPSLFFFLCPWFLASHSFSHCFVWVSILGLIEKRESLCLACAALQAGSENLHACDQHAGKILNQWAQTQ